MNRDQKINVAQELHQCLGKSQVTILADYKGVDVEGMNKLRRQLREVDSKIQVVKNTLLRRASEGTESAELKDFFTGPNSITTTETDPVSPAKVLVKFAEDNNKFQLKAAVLNGKVLDLEQIKALSKLPSKEILLAQFLSVLNAVPTGLVRVLSGVQRDFVNVVNAIKEKKEKE
ncbi:MAG: 50S ribosomal protein L10 [Deltaproteobacteria bacterium]|nr:MAG: 50S ribosomal protein L10 [Deltaproteobacteria bacterium]PIE75295.1 MAG: 50S ribosomal protein L10 [Deltaproteobacteria bacterium]